MNRLVTVLVFGLSPAALLQADFISDVGTLSSSTDVVEETFTLSSAATIGLQTWGFGGGTNAAGNLIAPGGTDPFLAIFFGTGAGATILTDGSSNPFGTSLDLSNYGSSVNSTVYSGDIYIPLTPAPGATSNLFVSSMAVRAYADPATAVVVAVLGSVTPGGGVACRFDVDGYLVTH